MRKRPPADHTDAVAFPDEVVLRPIGVVRSPYKERFGTPRQATVRGSHRDTSMEAAQVELFDWVQPELALRDIEGFERIWLLTSLHLNDRWAPLVRPPRGQSGRRRGVLSTRSPHHPNNIGLSAVLLDSVEGRFLNVRGIDFIDGTPVLDVKPYVPYCDAFADARTGWVGQLSEAPGADDRESGAPRPE
jgi:tRNA-Thr(GGU) m(6)t(6)A37 methyltransferase TsaA